jgi:hemolysin activation/secretion protein
MESEELGDNALHGSIELLSPDLSDLFGIWDKLRLMPYAFYDHAELRIKEALPDQDNHFTLKGAGAGVRGKVTDHFEYQVDWAVALADTRRVEKGDHTIFFRAKWVF